jgi:hypothetical protein
MVSLPFAYTCQYDDSGVALGLDPVTPTSFFVDITKLDGFDNAPFRVTSRAREGSDGGFVDAEFEDMRIITIEGIAYNCSGANLETLKANFAPSRTVRPFYAYLDTVGQRVVFCKSLGIRYAIDQSARLATFPFQVSEHMAASDSTWPSTSALELPSELQEASQRITMATSKRMLPSSSMGPLLTRRSFETNPATRLRSTTPWSPETL